MTDAPEQTVGHTAGETDEAVLVSGFVGLKCDAEGCGWADMTIPRPAYPDYLNAPCVNCGAPILTDEDWQFVQQVERAAAWVKDNASAFGIDLNGPSGPLVEIEYDSFKAAANSMTAAITKATS